MRIEIQLLEWKTRDNCIQNINVNTLATLQCSLGLMADKGVPIGVTDKIRNILKCFSFISHPSCLLTAGM